MKSLLRFATGGGSLFLLAFLGAAPAQDFADDDDGIPDGVEIRTRGPVHEAFAQPNDIKPLPGQAIPKEPPPPIPEEPPEQRPEGDNVQFIPGYWAWDDEQNQFLWVSGGYRNAPVGRQWIPGHWVHTDEGWRWVPGMWASEQQEELRYTPEPPAPLQVEPSFPAETEDSSWVPGSWVYRESRFAWRPGYWHAFRPGHVWVSSRYTWTPSGYLYCDGYWDYPLEDRGLLFAPVYFHRPFWHTRDWFWQPSHVVSFGLIYDSCFTHYGFSHLYFGNYYGARYHGYGYRPWFHGHGRHHSLFAHHRWHNHRHDRDWYSRQHDAYRDRHDGRQSGPPRNWAEQRALVNNKTVVKNTNINPVRVVAPLNQAKAINKNVNLVKLTAPQAETQRAAVRRTQEIAQARTKQAVAKVGDVKGTAPRTTQSFKLPPLVAGTQTVRPQAGAATTANNRGKDVGFSKKSDVSSPRKDLDNDRKGPNGGTNFAKPKGVNPPAVNNVPKVSNQNPGNKDLRPRGIDNTPAFKPKAESFKPPVINKPRNVDSSPPRVQGNKPQQPQINNPPKINNAPKAKSSANFDSPPRINNASPAVPKAKASPPKVNYSPPAPRNNDAPPRFTNPAPKVNVSPPKFNNPSPAPRNNPGPNFSNPAPRNFSAPRSAPPAPRAAPQAAPRNFSPARSSPPPPRASSAPAGRSAPANSAPRSGKGKGGRNE